MKDEAEDHGQPTTVVEEDTSVRLFDPANAPVDIAAGSLRAKYMEPPFSVLDRRKGAWQERGAQWKALGMESELGMRSEDGRKAGSGAYNPTLAADMAKIHKKNHGEEAFSELQKTGGISIFDPFLCEIAYHWFCPPGGVVLDPFAGGSVRGIICGSTGRSYVGIDLSGDQVAANRAQADRIFANPTSGEQKPIWVHGASQHVLGNEQVDPDMLFTCPPYGSLEVYSDDPDDISTMTPEEFARVYALILKESVAQLKDDRFAAIVVGNFRDKDGTLRNLVGLTVEAMRKAGARFYNEAIIIDPAATAAMRAPKQFNASRKLVRVHQSLLVFVKGDPKKAAALLRIEEDG
jgi:hypothetical protein